jgi:mannosyltransferase OCH1-like enzyme
VRIDANKNGRTLPTPANTCKRPLTLHLHLHTQPDFTCPNENRVGGHDSSGPMWTCSSHRLLARNECLIYSFGSNGKFTWEDGLVDLLGSTHCEIHVFDPADNARAGDDRLKNIHYHKWELKSSYYKQFNDELDRNARRDDEDTYKLTFQEILDKLGHQDRTIDILKMNFGETLTEWTTYKDWFKADIRQILVSTQGTPFSTGMADPTHLLMLMSDFFSAFTGRHFAMYSKDATAHGFDFSFVKLHPDFWKSGGQDFTGMRQVFFPTFNFTTPDPAIRIPRRMIFVYEKDLMVWEDPVEPFFNVWNTVETYRTAWNVSKADSRPWFVDSFTCLAIIFAEKVELVPYYMAETNQARKTDICRVAVMYLSGGYYFDVDLEVGSPYSPADDVSLVLARDGDDLSRQFMASEPRSSALKMALDRILASYKRNQTRPDFELGSEALAESIDALGSSLRSEIVPFKVIGGEISTPWILPAPPADSFNNPVPLGMREPPSPDFKIPRRLLFTYKSNLLEIKDPPLLYNNVENTIRKYREAWGDPDAPVWFLDDDDCRSAIYAARPNLVTYFDREPHGSWKADICRVAALYLTGGYYFDVDMEAVNPWMPRSNVSFATAIDPKKSRYFQSFLASEQNGRVIDEALNEMLLFYENQKLRPKSFLGPDTLFWALESVPPSELGDTVILEEVFFVLEDAEIKSRREAVGCCKSG